MANVNQINGFSPVGTVTGAAYNEQGRLYAIASDASNTYAIGDAVALSTGCTTDGVPYVTKLTTSLTPLGVIVGIRVADPGTSLQGNSLSLEKSYIGLSAGIRYVYVVDDPNILMEVSSDSTGQAFSDVGSNCNPSITANQTTLSMSAPYSSIVIDHTAVKALGTSGSLAYLLQIVGVKRTPDNNGGATVSTAAPYLRMLVKWNHHAFVGATGTA